MSVISLLQIWEPGTSVGQEGVKVSIEPTEAETIFFLKMDCDEARTQLGIDNGDKEVTCDYLVFFYRRSKKAEERKTVLCLLELKGNDTDHAIDQVIKTRENIRQKLLILKESDIWPYIERPVWKAYICCNSKSTITRSKKREKDIEKVFGKNNFKITHNNDLGGFLRN